MKLVQILQKSQEHNTLVSRNIVCILGMPFYCSSGKNSGFSDTWFPFYGIDRMGIFVKRFQDDGTLPEQFYKQFSPASCYDRAASQLPARFGSLIGLLISSILGGGLWQSKAGGQLMGHLQETYPLFYENAPEFEFVESRNRYCKENTFLINDWIKQQARIVNISHVPKCFPTSIEHLILMFQHSARHHEINPSVLYGIDKPHNNRSTNNTYSSPNKHNSCIIL